MPAHALFRSRVKTTRARSSFFHQIAAFALILLPGWSLAAPATDMGVSDPARASSMDMERAAPVEIPQAAQRSVLPNAGPFFDVEDIRITGIVDDDELGLYVSELLETGREALAEQAGEQEIQTQGYTQEELLEFARFLDRVEGSPNDDQTKIALMDELKQLREEQKGRRGVSVFDLQAVARAVQDDIRSTGLILAQVVVPPQTVTDGVVELRVYPGELGQVAVVNNRVYKSDTLVGAFRDQVGEDVVVGDIEETLRLVNDFPGMDVSGVFVPGSNPGETELRMNVINERRWSGTTRMDNHGADVTGRTRAMLGLDVYDVTGGGDTLSVDVLRSEGPNETTLGAVRYQRPVMGVRNFIDLGYSYNEFTIGVGPGVKVDTETQQYDAALGVHWRRSRATNLSQTVDVVYKDSDVQVTNNPQDSTNQKMLEFGSTLRYDTLIADWRMIFDGSTSLKIGNITSGEIEATTPDFAGQDTIYYVLSQDARIYKLFDLPIPLLDTTSQHSMLVRVGGQYSEQFLPAVSRYTLGGAQGVRSLLSDDVSVDKGVFASFQFYWQIPEAWDLDIGWSNTRLSETIRPYVFYDYAYGVQNAARLNNATQDDAWFEFGALGIGIEYNLFKNMRGGYNVHGSLNWARPEKSRFGDIGFEGVIEDEDRIYVDLTFEFDQAGFMGLRDK